jgi:NAD(P)-dependent dehydrogenase (short-subunit alcohol dehydrogenase family)
MLEGVQAGTPGRIINIASTAGLKGYAYVSAYTAAKHGVVDQGVAHRLGSEQPMAVNVTRTPACSCARARTLLSSPPSR